MPMEVGPRSVGADPPELPSRLFPEFRKPRGEPTDDPGKPAQHEAARRIPSIVRREA